MILIRLFFFFIGLAASEPTAHLIHPIVTAIVPCPLGLHGVKKPGQESSDSHLIHHLVDPLAAQQSSVTNSLSRERSEVGKGFLSEGTQYKNMFVVFDTFLFIFVFLGQLSLSKKSGNLE